MKQVTARNTHAQTHGEGNPQPQRKRGLWIALTIALVMVLLFEAGFFNLGHWRTKNLPAAQTWNPVIGSGLESLGNNEYKITDPEFATITVSVRQAESTVPMLDNTESRNAQEGKRDVTDSPVRVESVRVWATPNGRNNDNNQVNHYSRAAVMLHVTGGWTVSGDNWVDSRNSDGAWPDPKNYLDYTTNPASQYLLIGKKLQYYDSTEIQLRYFGDEGDIILFDRIEANPTIPFSLNGWRILLELAMAAFFVVFRPRAKIYAHRVRLWTWRRVSWLPECTSVDDDATAIGRPIGQALSVAMYVAAWGLLLTVIARQASPTQVYFNTSFHHWIDFQQYQRLADAIIHGHPWLDLPVDPSLSTMANPYDYFARVHLANGADASLPSAISTTNTGAAPHEFFWDHAYYNGHYYCYFGVVPCLLAYVPFQLLTGHALPNWVAIGLFSSLAVLFSTLLIRRLANDYFPRVSLGIVWLSTLGFNIGTNLFVYSYRAEFYGVPITCALALVFAGLWFWQISKYHAGDARSKHGQSAFAGGGVNPWLVAVGSVCMALLLGARPQFLVAWLLAFPIFWSQITKYRTLFSRQGLAATAAALIPFAAVSIPLLWYNYIRFGSWLNFGQNYNLTGYDLTSRHGSLYILPNQLFNQLFQPVGTTGAFPFVTTADVTLAGPNEPSIGGYFAIYPVALFALLFILARHQLRDHGVWVFSCVTTACAFVVVLFDCYKGGTTMRYLGDFGYLLMLTMVMVVFAYDSAIRQHPSSVPKSEPDGIVLSSLGFRTLQTVLLTLVFVTFIINLFGLFAVGLNSDWYSTHSGLYTTVRSWFIGLTA